PRTSLELRVKLPANEQPRSWRALEFIAAHIQTSSEASKPITRAIALQRTTTKEPPTIMQRPSTIQPMKLVAYNYSPTSTAGQQLKPIKRPNNSAHMQLTLASSGSFNC
ncbi:hypothetical protein Dimus_004205, partial [Dionaea muscipula]